MTVSWLVEASFIAGALQHLQPKEVKVEQQTCPPPQLLFSNFPSKLPHLSLSRCQCLWDDFADMLKRIYEFMTSSLSLPSSSLAADSAGVKEKYPDGWNKTKKSDKFASF